MSNQEILLVGTSTAQGLYDYTCEIVNWDFMRTTDFNLNSLRRKLQEEGKHYEKSVIMSGVLVFPTISHARHFDYDPNWTIEGCRNKLVGVIHLLLNFSNKVYIVEPLPRTLRPRTCTHINREIASRFREVRKTFIRRDDLKFIEIRRIEGFHCRNNLKSIRKLVERVTYDGTHLNPESYLQLAQGLANIFRTEC